MMIIKPEWVSHADRTQDARNKKPCIYSIHVHPDGQRLATGSLDGTVKIWNTKPILEKDAQKDPNCHKLLCTMTMHNGAVLCVRWSSGDGRYLASSSDNDNVIIIWERDRNATTGSVFGSNDVNHEAWRPVKYLRGHESDVQDLAWSKDNKYLASCGVDGFVIVWNGATFEQITKIDQHSDFVKGVTWDPAGKFLASQSDDKMVKVFRTSDWGLEADLISPFINAPGTTLFRRLSWSPDGAHVAAANAVNGIQCIAAIINRDDWNADVSLVGHQLPIEITSYNPKMFYVQRDKESEKSLATICALGSQDRSISIWVTQFNRPVCVAADIFDNNVYDIAWTPDGKNLFACSQDGTVACILLDKELDDVAPDDVVYKELVKYGYGRKNTQLPETPSQLELEEDFAIVSKASTSKRLADLMTGNASIETLSVPTIKSSGNAADVTMTDAEPSVPSNSSSSIASNSAPLASSTSTVIAEQKVTILKNGKRRIQPMRLSATSSTATSSQTTPQPSNMRSHSQSDISSTLYDNPTIPSSGVGTTATGNKRKKDDSNENEAEGGNKPTRSRPEWLDSAVVPPVVQKSQVKMGVPKVKSILSSKLNPSEPTVVIECHNAPSLQDPSVHVRTKVIASKQGAALWKDYLPSAAILMTGNHLYTVVACEDGSLVIYSATGRRLLPPIILESTSVILQCSSQWLICLTATGLLYTWDVVNLKNSLDGISIAPILQVAKLTEGTAHKTANIKDVRIQKNGIPILITSLQQAFVYHLDMKVWLRISDAWYIISEFWGSGLQPSSNSYKPAENPLGWLSSRMTLNGNGVDPTTKLILDIANTDESTAAVITISHIETQLAVAALLDSPNEYSDWMMYYARKLSQENAHDKIQELCKWLMGPPFAASEFAKWEPTIMGTLTKNDILKQILPVLAQNRELQRIVTEIKSYI
ncbi:WD40-repeat-containing domain protein [Parasitella parasitica]|nr:WD40-repeat-containing domain protein [Parasitella parasitica]